MFPPRQHNTGIQALDSQLNHHDEQMKNGYNTGNKDRDTELNASHQRGLERDEEAGRQHSMSGTEYEDARRAQDYFLHTEEGKALSKQEDEAWKNVKPDANGAKWATAETHQAHRNYVQVEHDFMKNNCNKQTYDNYCKINQERLSVLKDEGK
jgi:hypothetical protein